MLTRLTLRGLVVLDDVALELAPGLNVVTGETGAGKSLIVGGLALVRGARTGALATSSGEVAAEFQLPPDAAAAVDAKLAARGLPELERGRLSVRRLLGGTRRARTELQGETVGLALLAELGAELLEITSQHEQQSLCDPTSQLALLDDFAGLTARAAEYQLVYRELCRTRAERLGLAEAERTRALRAEVLAHQLEELDELSPRPAELGELARRVQLMRDARRLAELGAEVKQVLVEDDAATLPRLSLLARRLLRGEPATAEVGALYEALEAARAAAEHAADAAERLMEAIDFAPGELETAEARLAELARLAHRHATSGDALCEVRDRIARELGELESAAEALAAVAARERELEARGHELASALHAARNQRAPELARAIEAELGELCMPHARVSVAIEAGTELGAFGYTRMQLALTANPGLPPAPLSKVASGGELSRVLLALKSAIGAIGTRRTLVFDEVDAGVGGRVADAIGDRLAKLARHHQVICVTHLPQIAAFAEAHFVVDKRVELGRAATSLRRLDGPERVVELARMLGGSAISAENHARALLEAACRPQGPRRAAHTRPHAPTNRSRRARAAAG